MVERGEDDGVGEDVVVCGAYLRMVEVEYEDSCDDGKELEAAEDVSDEEVQNWPRQCTWLWEGMRLSPCAYALRKAELLEDMRCISTQIAQCAPEEERMHKERLRQKQQHQRFLGVKR